MVVISFVHDAIHIVVSTLTGPAGVEPNAFEYRMFPSMQSRLSRSPNILS